MSMIWAGAVEIALAWAVILGVKIASNAFEWKFEHLLPNYWYPVVKRKLAKPETATLKDKGIPKKISDELEGLLAFMQGGSLQNSRIRMDRTFQDKIEHETKQLKKRGLARQFHFTNLKLSEKNEKKKDFRHWSDAGREWREAILQGTVSNRYRNKKSGKILYEDFFPHGAILLRQSRHIRHDEVESKNRNEEQQFYSEYQKIMCPSCGAEISLNSNEVHCPYCGGYIKSDFFDWQIEELLIYQDLNPNDYNYKMVAATLLVFFLPAVPCFRFIQSVEIILAVPFVLTVILAVILGAVLLKSKNSTEGLEEQIVRYDEKVLLVDLNEALNDAELTSDLLFYSVDKLQLKAVDNTETQTTITIQAILHKLILRNNQKIIKKDKKMELKLYRARHPRRMKSKGQAVFSEKECPSCGANFMPDKNGCCSYCGYQLTVDNSKWRLVNL